MVNIRGKGQRGEREVATLLNGMLLTTMRDMGYSEPEIIAAATSVQRNQNQSAVGGNDLTNTMGLSIEVKRHENLSGINGWWAQTTAAAAKNAEHPVLLYRQNHGQWRCRTVGHLALPFGEDTVPAVMDFDYLSFQAWYRAWTRDWLLNGGLTRI